MDEWDIDVPEVVTLAESTRQQAIDLAPSIDGTILDQIVETLNWGDGIAGQVALESRNFFDSQSFEIDLIVRRILAGLDGAIGAATAYREADFDMAAEFQSRAASSAESGDFSWFAQNGVVTNGE